MQNLNINSPKYKAYALNNFRKIPQINNLSEEEQFAIEVVGHVLPFRSNNYVVEELINWDNVPNDPIFILNFPQKGMLKPRHFDEMANLLRRKASKREIKEAEERIKVPENAKKQEISTLKSECETRVEEAMWKLREIEASRDAKIRIHEQEISKLEEQTATIIGQMDKLAKLREVTLDQFSKLGIKQKRSKYTLVHMPFYVVCYRVNSKKQYNVFPPSVTNSMSLSVRVKTLHRAKVKRLLAQRSKSIASIIAKFPTIMEQDAVFQREIDEAGEEANTLQSENLRESVRNGLEKLKEEGGGGEE